MLKFAIIGTGYIAQNHADALKKLSDKARIAAVIGRNPVTGCRFEEMCGCKWYSTLSEAEKEVNIDAVDICLPTGLHERFVIEAAEAGLHVICEKPVTFTIESFERMVQACEINNVRFMVAQVARWETNFTIFKKYVQEGRIGSIHMISYKLLCQHPTWSSWHRDPEMSGGGLYDLNVHEIDALVSLFGKPDSVFCDGWKSSTGCLNHVITQLNWADGTKACVEASLEMTGNVPFSSELRATGDKGTLCYTFSAGVNINDGKSVTNMFWYPADSEEVTPILFEEEDAFELELREFIDAVENKRETSVTFDENRIVLSVIEASIRSYENNIVVKLN